MRKQVVKQPIVRRKVKKKLINSKRASRTFHHRTVSFARWGREAGKQDACSQSIEHAGYQKKALNALWVEKLRNNVFDPKKWDTYHRAARGYVEGYCLKLGMPKYDWVLLPTNKSVAVIMTVMNEEATMQGLIEQLNRLPFDEIIIVVNGSQDQTYQKARQLSHATIIYYPHPLGHDIGRSLGAKVAQSEILLFIDGDIPLRAEELVPFIYAVDQGMDVALNNIMPYIPLFSERDAVSHVKEFLNRSLRRPDLQVNSLTSVPHAISRHALNTVGYADLSVPPKAQASAILNGLRIGAPYSINVISKNRRNKHNTSSSNPVANMIIGDHVEALKYAKSFKGNRLTFPDNFRNRKLLRGG
ncbi:MULTISPECIES: glycosyltransferase [unclassified Paenibacillus]|uniref:glycosyltransferase family 2 protein n=1 Tax=unclassified Paenibacillus TaxID=185978 RepID=UPI00278701EF|nr:MULTISPECIES: glycosyltransferase [unclassified Paenibacillus]MDQ0901544.1 hypothetical protein [Paenibacillus sp. V4I7]MDQ0919953.1 hypothetical protein [Paenibacillus sp. V4I5]